MVKNRFHTNKIPKNRVPLMLGMIVIGLLLLQVVVSNRLANYGTHITQIETDITQLTQENQLLSEQIASESALMAISTKANTLGFTKTTTPVFLSDLPVALNSR